jgi:hypothetical protein
MRTKLPFLFLFIAIFALPSTLEAQINSRYGPMGRRRMASQVQEAPEKAQPMTAEELVDAEMPKITEAIDLNEFEQAVVRSILTKYVQQRIEVQILNLGPEKTREAFESIKINQDEELRASLPEDKFLALEEYRENGGKKSKKKKKKNKS